MKMASDSKYVVPVTFFMERNVLHVHPLVLSECEVRTISWV